MRKAAQFTTFVNRLKHYADIKNVEEASKVIQEGKLILRLPQLLPKDQITVLEAFDKMDISNSTLWNTITSNFNQTLDKKMPYDIARMGSILLKHIESDKIDWKGIEARIRGDSILTMEFDPQVINIHNFMATHGRGSDEFWDTTEDLCINSLENAKISDFKSEMLANLLSKLIWSYTASKKGSDAFWQAVDRLVEQYSTQINAINYSKLVLAVSKAPKLSVKTKDKLLAQATFHLSDPKLQLRNLHDIILGLNTIDPSKTKLAAESLARHLIALLQDNRFLATHDSLNTLHRTCFELTQLSAIDSKLSDQLHDEVSSKLNEMPNLSNLQRLDVRAWMYFASLRNISKPVKDCLVELVMKASFKVEDLVNLDPADYFLVHNFKALAPSLNLDILPNIPQTVQNSNSFMVNRLASCLAKLELSKLNNFSPYFISDLAVSFKQLLKDLESLFREGVLSPPLATTSSCTPLFGFLSDSTSIHVALRRLSRLYPAFTLPEITAANCQLITLIYLRHEEEEDISKSTETFLQHNIATMAVPFLNLTVAALSKKLSVSDKVDLIKALDLNKFQQDSVVLANSLILYYWLTNQKKAVPNAFVSSLADLSCSIDALMEAVLKHIQNKYWSPEDAKLFTPKPVASVSCESLAATKDAMSESVQQKDPKIEKESVRTSSKPKTMDPLAQLLIKFYPKDPDFDFEQALFSPNETKKGQITWQSVINKPRRPSRRDRERPRDSIFNSSFHQADEDEEDFVKH